MGGEKVSVNGREQMSGTESTRWVLVVEDSSAMRSFIRTTVEEMGNVSVTEAASGFDALRILPTRPFSLIITDINMPDINGLELIGFTSGASAFLRHPDGHREHGEDGGRPQAGDLWGRGIPRQAVRAGGLQALVARVLEEGPPRPSGRGRSGE